MKKNFIALSFAILMLPLIFSFVSASEKEVNVGIYVLNIGKFDISTGSYTIDFYLSMKCENKCPSFDYEFMNGRASSVDKIIDTENERFYRIQANLNSQVDLKRFPFDTQVVQIILEDKKTTTDNLVYVADFESSGVDDSIMITGWRLMDPKITVSEHNYEIYDEVYSQYSFELPIKRITLSSIFKTFLPIIFIVLVMLSSFVLDPDKITTRLAMAGSALVASVMFHVSLANQIPPVGYLTMIDKFMILTYAIIVLTFGFNVVLLQLHEEKQEEKVKKFHRMTEFTMFIFVPIVYVLFFIFFYFGII